MQALRPRGDVREQRPGVEERRLVRVVLEGDEVKTHVLAQLCERDDVLRALVLGGDERAERQLVAVVSQLVPSLEIYLTPQ